MSNKNLGLVVLIGAIAAALGIVFSSGGQDHKKNDGPGLSTETTQIAVRDASDGLPGLLTTAAPWASNTEQLSDRLATIGMPQLKSPGTAAKLHGHLDIIIDGQPVTVPANIGIPATHNFVSIITTTDTSGIFSVQSPTRSTFYLGQLFDTWGVRFSTKCIGSYCTNGTKQLQIFADGTEVITDPRKLVLDDHQEIVILFAAPGELPAHIPRSYNFPAGQ